MTLLELRDQHPDRFYPQKWYDDEPFAHTDHPPSIHTRPPTVGGFECYSKCPVAVQLARIFIDHPFSPAWDRYIWTRDVDSQGQRVYVGQNGRGLEIHRHLHITERWGVARW